MQKISIQSVYIAGGLDFLIIKKEPTNIGNNRNPR